MNFVTTLDRSQIRTTGVCVRKGGWEKKKFNQKSSTLKDYVSFVFGAVLFLQNAHRTDLVCVCGCESIGSAVLCLIGGFWSISSLFIHTLPLLHCWEGRENV